MPSYDPSVSIALMYQHVEDATRAFFNSDLTGLEEAFKAFNTCADFLEELPLEEVDERERDRIFLRMLAVKLGSTYVMVRERFRVQ